MELETQKKKKKTILRNYYTNLHLPSHCFVSSSTRTLLFFPSVIISKTRSFNILHWPVTYIFPPTWSISTIALCRNHGRRTSLLVDCPSTADPDWTRRDKLSRKHLDHQALRVAIWGSKPTGGILPSPVLSPRCFISLFKAQRMGQCTTARLGVVSTCEEEFICWWAQLLLRESLSGWRKGMSGSSSSAKANAKPCTFNGATLCNSTD